MKEIWPVRIDSNIKQAFIKAARRQGVDVSSLRRAAYDEFMINHPSFFDRCARERAQSADLPTQEVA